MEYIISRGTTTWDKKLENKKDEISYIVINIERG